MRPLLWHQFSWSAKLKKKKPQHLLWYSNRTQWLESIPYRPFCFYLLSFTGLSSIHLLRIINNQIPLIAQQHSISSCPSFHLLSSIWITDVWDIYEESCCQHLCISSYLHLFLFLFIKYTEYLTYSMFNCFLTGNLPKL